MYTQTCGQRSSKHQLTGSPIFLTSSRKSKELIQSKLSIFIKKCQVLFRLLIVSWKNIPRILAAHDKGIQKHKSPLVATAFM